MSDAFNLFIVCFAYAACCVGALVGVFYIANGCIKYILGK